MLEDEGWWLGKKSTPQQINNLSTKENILGIKINQVKDTNIDWLKWH